MLKFPTRNHTTLLISLLVHLHFHPYESSNESVAQHLILTYHRGEIASVVKKM